MKDQFPLLANTPELCFVDNASTTQKPQQVINFVDHVMSMSNANTGRGSYPLMFEAENIIDQSRWAVASYLWTNFHQVIFTNNATHWFNLLANSFAISWLLQPWKNIVLSLAEHHANIVPWQALQRIIDFEIRRCEIDLVSWKLNLGSLISLCDENTVLVSVTAISNVLGVQNQIVDIKELIWPEILLCVDASQLIPHFTWIIDNLNADVVVRTWHKMFAYPGVGWIWMSQYALDLLPSWSWGGGVVQDVTCEWFSLKKWYESWEAGTLNLAWIASLWEACRWMNQYDREFENKRVADMTACLYDSLSEIDWITILWWKEDRHSLVTFHADWIENYIRFAEQLWLDGICVRIGWHCAYPLAHHVGVRNTIRVSLTWYNTMADIERVIERIRLH